MWEGRGNIGICMRDMWRKGGRGREKLVEDKKRNIEKRRKEK